jgi:hypothetical protein
MRRLETTGASGGPYLLGRRLTSSLPVLWYSVGSPEIAATRPQPTFNGAEVSALDQRQSQVALKFGDQDFQFLFRQVTRIALRQIGRAALKFERALRRLNPIGE